jgi:hypothetical protein
MAGPFILRVSATREGPIPELVLPNPFLHLLAAFCPWFRTPSATNFAWVVAGEVRCLGHSITWGR